jgi:hypothetical protein
MRWWNIRQVGCSRARTCAALSACTTCRNARRAYSGTDTTPMSACCLTGSQWLTDATKEGSGGSSITMAKALELPGTKAGSWMPGATRSSLG